MSAKFTMLELSASNNAWKEAEEKHEMKIKGENGDWMSIDLKISEEEGFKHNMYAERLFGIPKGDSYVRTFFECLCNCLCDFSLALKKDLKPADSYAEMLVKETTVEGIPLEMRHQMAQIGQLLQWMVNSTSWKTGRYEPFDAFEIRQKLNHASIHSSLTLNKDAVTAYPPVPPNTYPTFEPVSRDRLQAYAEPVMVSDNLGSLINGIMDRIKDSEIPYESKFVYIVSGKHFSAFGMSQLMEEEAHDRE